jgi:glutamyl-tRNA(Gln) amidotransferase subunit D
MGIDPLGSVAYPSREVTLKSYTVRRGNQKLALRDKLDEHCGLVQFYPGMSPDLLKVYEGYRGLVLAGTGLGHVSTTLIPSLQKLIKRGTLVVMTSQCMQGRVCDRVYDTGRDLLKAGVIEGGDMLPEVALVKMMWVLGNERNPEKAAERMQANLKGECNRRSTHGL